MGGAEAKHRLAALAMASASPSAWAAEAQAANSCGEKRSANGASDDRAAFNNSVGLGSDAWTGVRAGSSGSGWLMFMFGTAVRMSDGRCSVSSAGWGPKCSCLALDGVEQCGRPAGSSAGAVAQVG